MHVKINEKRKISSVNPMIYGQFIEHFHRQIYGGVYDPTHPLADEDGFRTDVLNAMRKIKVPILRWPGGCFVSAYHWKEGVGKNRTPMFDKAWRVEEPNSFGTDEYIKLCQKIGCEPYICTNAGTGTPEEMSDWVEYCNLKEQGKYTDWRKENGYEEPHNVKYWSIGNENYGSWEIGAKTSTEWGRLVTESAKMMKRTDPSIELSAAALADMEWNMEILKNCGERLSWISLHGYWDFHKGTNSLESYEECMAYTDDLDAPVRQVKSL
ncbi:MAG: alpha-N-arabinofuranosidase, partial [Lachnospiraceae bacterium]|nr:alpha-N-arabinofuranosidase [Lachnospiraceae bacterium]